MQGGRGYIVSEDAQESEIAPPLWEQIATALGQDTAPLKAVLQAEIASVWEVEVLSERPLDIWLLAQMRYELSGETNEDVFWELAFSANDISGLIPYTNRCVFRAVKFMRALDCEEQIPDRVVRTRSKVGEEIQSAAYRLEKTWIMVWESIKKDTEISSLKKEASIDYTDRVLEIHKQTIEALQAAFNARMRFLSIWYVGECNERASGSLSQQINDYESQSTDAKQQIEGLRREAQSWDINDYPDGFRFTPEFFARRNNTSMGNVRARFRQLQEKHGNEDYVNRDGRWYARTKEAALRVELSFNLPGNRRRRSNNKPE